MSRSRRKTPIVGHTTCGSEREDKKLWHQRWRTRERTALTSASPEALSAHPPPVDDPPGLGPLAFPKPRPAIGIKAGDDDSTTEIEFTIRNREKKTAA